MRPRKGRRGKKAGTERVDRIILRWYSRATGGASNPQFISARELAFEARIEAMVEGGGRPGVPYANRHVRAAIQRHITEQMLANLPVSPAPTPAKIGAYAEAARALIEQRVGGRARLNKAASEEGIVSDELNALLRRQARASWYLDKMVAPMLLPTDLDLREVHKSGATPYTNLPFDKVRARLRSWYIATRLARALDNYYRNIRSRVTVKLIGYDLT